MTAHTELQIHKTGVQLLALIADVQAALPRTFRHYGNRIGDEVTDLLVAIARANASKGRARFAHRAVARAPGRRADHASRCARQAPDLAEALGTQRRAHRQHRPPRRRLAQGVPQRACSMTVKVVMPVRELNLVEPLPHEGTAMRTTETAARAQARSGAVSPLIDRNAFGAATSIARRHAVLAQQRVGAELRRRQQQHQQQEQRAPRCRRPQIPAVRIRLSRSTTSCRPGRTAGAPSATATARRPSSARRAPPGGRCTSSCSPASGGPGRSFCFVVTQPKCREVWAAPFRDRIVHHLLYAAIAPRFLASFVHTSSACIPGKGTLFAAAARAPRALDHAELEAAGLVPEVRPRELLRLDRQARAVGRARGEAARAVLARSRAHGAVPRPARRL
jgi:hypothetical protein